MNDGATDVPQGERYPPIRDYAAIGDGRTIALVARSGSVDWLPLPDLDSPSAFGAILDAERGGRFVVRPDVPSSVERRYLPGTNVLETMYSTELGIVRTTMAMTLPDEGLTPLRELTCRIEGVSGSVPMRWHAAPRFGYGTWTSRVSTRAGVPVFIARDTALAVPSWDAGEPRYTDDCVEGRFRTTSRSDAVVALAIAHREPLVLPAREEVIARLGSTIAFWEGWAERLTYDGPWRDAVVRSALALKLLAYAPSGAIAAAATTSLPEVIGGSRNWDYRFSWIRDSVFTIDAFLELGCPTEATAYLWWLMHASQLTRPRLQPLYRLDGGSRAPERILPLDGYCSSRPVRTGNAAADQLQLDTYGELLQTAWRFVEAGNALDRDMRRELAETADFVCRVWHRPDAGIWEVRSAPRHFTQSKMMCWLALDRAVRLAELGGIDPAHVERWRTEAASIRAFVETECWSDDVGGYTGAAGSSELDAAVLLAIVYGYGSPNHERLRATVDTVERELTVGPFVRRYTGDDGLPGSEGRFLACSFWLVESLARLGRMDEAARQMDELVALSNDVGLFAEEIDPSSLDFLGNFPQGLTHLALISAAVAVGERHT